jgi:hypothetical protein
MLAMGSGAIERSGWMRFLKGKISERIELRPIATPQGKIVLVQYYGPADPETGGSYTVKRYRSEKSPSVEGEWKHTKITLEPLNPEFKPIILEPEDEAPIQVIAEYLRKLGSK